MKYSLLLVITVCSIFIHSGKTLAEDNILGFKSELKTIVVHNDGKSQWFHPRACFLPSGSNQNGISGVLTIQKHLGASDFYSGMSVMYQNQANGEWSAPVDVPELKWRRESKEVILGVCDVTPAWHEKTRKVIAIGVQLRYSNEGVHLYDKYRSYDVAYSVFDPETKEWSVWKAIANSPTDKKFHLFAPGCTQFHVKDDGTVLLPIYYGLDITKPLNATVLECSFDGNELKYQKHGTDMELDVVRGLVEPSLVKFKNRFFLTVRNDVKGYITSSSDGLNYDPIKPWTFDDGKELGSYNTQQHWLSHSDGLFLVYTRRGANNDMIMRHRAPLFMAQVDPEKLVVIRKTEQALVPNRGAQLGNFGACIANEKESWVTVSEGIFGNEQQRKEKMKMGANGSTFLVKILWDKPNKLAK
jgi:hypothetical protein